MLLRSSSTPVLGSLLPSFSESPNNNHHHSENHTSTPKHALSSIHGKLVSSCSNHFTKPPFHPPSVTEVKSCGFRRVQSEGNLEDLTDASYTIDDFTLPKRYARRTSLSNLEAIPSFSFTHLGTRFEDDDSDYEEEEEEEEKEESGFENSCKSMRVEDLVSEQLREHHVDGYGNLSFEGAGKMYLATGLGLSSCGGGGGSGGGGSNYRPVDFHRDGHGGDGQGINMEEHYKNMLDQNPGNPLFMRNYAQFLYQEKRDLKGAEEYYSRAILADPEDGELLSQYAKLIWELHHDKDRATSYFHRAIQASSADSHVHAAYASFLWDAEEDDEENTSQSPQVGQLTFYHGLMASATA